MVRSSNLFWMDGQEPDGCHDFLFVKSPKLKVAPGFLGLELVLKNMGIIH